MDTNKIDLRYPEGADMVWVATEPGFYALLEKESSGGGPLCLLAECGGELGAPPPITPSALPFVSATFGGKRNPGGGCAFSKRSYYAECAMLGPYDTPTEARAALKAYAIAVVVDYPFAVFEEPSGETVPLDEWRQRPD